jgi:AP-3 complex subunit delta-1
MAKIVPTHPHLITEYQDTILSSINDQDISIRMRALGLLSAMVSLIYGSLENIAHKMLHSRPIVEICSRSSSNCLHTLFEIRRYYPRLHSPWLRM